MSELCMKYFFIVCATYQGLCACKLLYKLLYK
uniref:Uncharacterized protein n=1 Tax=Anguilla anguilla TaxID=7936 RepID=A0A0E9T2Y8_ANGAN